MKRRRERRVAAVLVSAVALVFGSGVAAADDDPPVITVPTTTDAAVVPAPDPRPAPRPAPKPAPKPVYRPPPVRRSTPVARTTPTVAPRTATVVTRPRAARQRPKRKPVVKAAQVKQQPKRQAKRPKLRVTGVAASAPVPREKPQRLAAPPIEPNPKGILSPLAGLLLVLTAVLAAVVLTQSPRLRRRLAAVGSAARSELDVDAPPPLPAPPPHFVPTTNGASKQALESLQIVVWSGYFKSTFCAAVDTPGADQQVVLAESPPFRHRGDGIPKPSDDARAAYTALTERLLRDGWTSDGDAVVWYATRWRREPAAEPAD